MIFRLVDLVLPPRFAAPASVCSFPGGHLAKAVAEQDEQAPADSPIAVLARVLLGSDDETKSTEPKEP